MRPGFATDNSRGLPRPLQGNGQERQLVSCSDEQFTPTVRPSAVDWFTPDAVSLCAVLCTDGLPALYGSALGVRSEERRWKQYHSEPFSEAFHVRDPINH